MGVFRKNDVHGFDARWMERIMHCISIVSYSVVLNGVSGMVFTLGRGLRKEDPLSPFLFLICSERAVNTFKACNRGRSIERD